MSLRVLRSAALTGILALLWALALCLPSTARGAGRAGGPWSLAFVVEGSVEMTRPWRESSRREALERALNLELRTLPLRASAAVWLAQPGGVEPLVPPSTALELKDLDLRLPQPRSGRVDLGPALAQASAWLAGQGGGSLVVVAADGLRGGSSLRALEAGGVFCHVLALAPAGGGQALAGLALAGGGSCFVADRPSRVLPLLHRAVLTCLTPARLLIEAHDPANRPLRLAYGLERRDALARRRQGLTGRVQQLLPGVYRLAWPASAPTGPAPVPARVSVAPRGLTMVSVGGRAKLAVEARDQQGRDPGWKLRVARLSDGLVLESSRRTPFELALFAGTYLVKALQQPLAWTVLLEAGRDRKLVVGPVGGLRVRLRGPQGPLRARYRLYDLLAQRPGGTGYTNQLLRVKPGPFRLELEVPPGLEREVVVPPGREVELALPAAGGVLVGRGRPGQVVEVVDQRGLAVASGPVNRVLPLLPGAYLVRLAQARGGGRQVRVEGGRLVTLPAGELLKSSPDRTKTR